jgi:hypothetical protein
MTMNNPTSESAAAPPPAHGLKFRFAALGLVVVSGLAGLGLARCLKDPVAPTAPPEPPAAAFGAKFPGRLFTGWSKPDFVFLVSGQQHGYLSPCGCSRPQKGGLERRYNFLKQLEQEGSPVIPIDLGDVPQVQGPANLPNIQGLIKYRYSMMALKAMNYAAVGFGAFEDAQPLYKAFEEWCFNEPQPPVLGANLVDKDGIFKGGNNSSIQDVVFRKVDGVTVGITGLLAPSVYELKMTDKKFGYADCATTLPAVLKQLDAGKANVRVLLYQGTMATIHMKGKDPEIFELVKRFPEFNLAVCLSEDDEPSAKAVTIKNTMAVSLGHKGRYVGVVGVWKTGKADRPFELKYQLVELGEDYLTPKTDVKGHKILGIMEKYTAELKNGNYLAKYPQAAHMHEVAILGIGGKVAPHYVGTESCKGCHSDAYDKWKHTPHSLAYKTLEDDRNPSLKQYDPECIVCHTVGFGYKTGFRNEVATPKLKNVGCESCHGPGSGHIEAEQLLEVGKASPLSKPWRDLLNPWRTPAGVEPPAAANKRILRADAMCQQCHDKDNDVTWLNKAFERKWVKIWHYEDRMPGRQALIEEFTKKEAEAKKKEEEAKKEPARK